MQSLLLFLYTTIEYTSFRFLTDLYNYQGFALNVIIFYAVAMKHNYS